MTGARSGYNGSIMQPCLHASVTCMWLPGDKRTYIGCMEKHRKYTVAYGQYLCDTVSTAWVRSTEMEEGAGGIATHHCQRVR